MKKAAFSILELTFTVTIFMVLLVYTVPQLVHSIFRNDLEVATQELVHVLRQANAQAATQISDSAWGVKFLDSTTDSYVLYAGSTYAGRDTTLDITYPLPDSVTFSSISLQGGGSEVTFNQVTGATSQYGTITLVSSSGGTTRTITVNTLGNATSN